MNESFIPKILRPLYRTRINNNYIAVMNPYTYHGFVFLDKKSQSLLKAIDGKRTVGEISKQGKKLHIDSVHVHTLLETFETTRIVTVKNEPNLFNPRKGKDSIHVGAIGIWVSLTNNCNLRCKYCYVPKSHLKMSTDTIDHFLTEMCASSKKNNINDITLVLAGGEPLLALDLIDYLLKALALLKKNKSNPSFHVGIVTNGTLLTEKVALFLKKNDIFVTISIDGYAKEQNFNRPFKGGRESYTLVSRGIKVAKLHNLGLQVSAVVTSSNVDFLPEFIDEVVKKWKIVPYLSFFMDNPLAQNALLPNTDKTAKSVKRILRTIHNAFDDTHVSLIRSGLYFDSFPSVGYFFPSLSNCVAGSSYFSLSHDGRLKICPQMEEDLEFVKKVNDPIDYIRSENAKRYLAKGSTVESIALCKKCLWKYICAGGCRAERSKNLNKPTYYCRAYKQILPYAFQMEAKRIFKQKIKLLSTPKA